MTLTTDREEFEQWAELACELPWGFLAKRRKDSGEYADSTYEDMWKAWVAGREALANREAQPVADGENCWSCGNFFTYAQHSECDGYCPHCNAPVDLDEEEIGDEA